MAVGYSTSTQIPAAIQLFYDKILLRRALPYLAHALFGQQRPVDMNSGDQPKFRRYNSLPLQTSPLVEGITPAAQQLSKTDITGQLVQYGAYVTITDYVEMTTEDRILTETAEILGESAGQSLDVIYRDTLVAGTTVQYSGSATTATAVNDQLVAADLNKAIRTLDSNNAKYWREQPIIGKDRVGTNPIAAAYFSIVHPRTVYDLKAITGFVQVHEYADPSAAVPGEVGAFNQIRFIQSTYAKTSAGGAGGSATDALWFTSPGTATNNNLLQTLIFGQDAYGITALGGQNFETITKPRGAGEDALNQRSTMGWKATTDIQRLNENFMLNLKHPASE